MKRNWLIIEDLKNRRFLKLEDKTKRHNLKNGLFLNNEYWISKKQIYKKLLTFMMFILK
ncbi:hypothetical protein PGA11657_03410 [Lactobacillus paragasseri]|nr:hypothetical protein PGA11657_03410 [Lactobacillus paragasseri]